MCILPGHNAASITDSEIRNNSARRGGGLFLASDTAKTAILSRLAITGNASTYQGGGIFVIGPNLTLDYSRIVNNTASAGTGIYRLTTTGTTTAINNWWGCSTGPGTGLCDTAVTVDGMLDYDPWLRVRLSSSSVTSLLTNQSSTLTASFLTNSDGETISAANLPRVIGQGVTWGNSKPLLGSLSSGQTTIQSDGTATANFRATNPSSDTLTLYAQVDHDNTAPTSSNILNPISILKANTSTTIVSDDPDPSEPDDLVTVEVSVTGSYGNTPTAPTGNIIVSDGIDSCTITLPDASCSLTLTTPGNRTLTATYAGDASFYGSTSLGVSHTVDGPPRVTNVSSTILNDAYSVSTEIPVAVTFSEPVHITGMPKLTLGNRVHQTDWLTIPAAVIQAS